MLKSVLLVLVLFLVGFQQVSAKRVKFDKVEQIKVVHDFPNTEEYQDEDGNYFDLGIIYEVYGTEFMPLWLSEEPRIIGLLNRNTDYYYELDSKFVDEVIVAHGLDKSKMLTLSFWDKYLGTFVIGVGTLLAFIYSIIVAKKENLENGDDKIEIVEAG